MLNNLSRLSWPGSPINSIITIKGHSADTVFGFDGAGRLLILAGAFLILVGLSFTLWPRPPLLGRLPGDILVQREGFRLIFPLATCLLISLVLTVLLNLVFKLLR